MILYLSPPEVEAVQTALVAQLFNLEEGGGHQPGRGPSDESGRGGDPGNPGPDRRQYYGGTVSSNEVPSGRTIFTEKTCLAIEILMEVENVMPFDYSRFPQKRDGLHGATNEGVK